MPSSTSTTALRAACDPAGERDELLERLMASLLHDARNPLNALSITLEVLTERLRREPGGNLAAANEKSLRSMREQIGRVDGILKRFVDFLAPRPEPPGGVDLSALALQAIELLGHEARCHRVQVRAAIDPEVKARVPDPQGLRRQVLDPICRAIATEAPGSEVVVTVRVERAQAVFRVEGAGGLRGLHERVLQLE